MPDSVFGSPYTQPSRPSPATSEISRVTRQNFPHIPSRRPRRVHRCFSVIPIDDCGLSHLTTGSALSMTSDEAQYRFLVSTACEFAMLRVVSFLFLLSCRFGVFSIRLVLRVASQNRIFASRAYRKFPAPDFNRLVSPLPRRTVRLSYRLFVFTLAIAASKLRTTFRSSQLPN